MKELEKKKKEIENEDRDGFGNFDDDDKPPLYIDPISFCPQGDDVGEECQHELFQE